MAIFWPRATLASLEQPTTRQKATRKDTSKFSINSLTLLLRPDFPREGLDWIVKNRVPVVLLLRCQSYLSAVNLHLPKESEWPV